MAGEFYISGLTENSFDYQAYLDKYRELKMIPVNLLAQQVDQINAQREALSAIKSKLDSLYAPALNLTLETTYETKTATLSNPEVADVSVDSNAVNSTYTLTVNSLARENKFKIGTVETITDIYQTIDKEGSLQINYLKDGEEQTLTIDYNGKSLKDIVDEINQSEDIQASIINLGTEDNPDYQLIISSKNTGTRNRIVSIDDTLNSGDDSDGIFSEDEAKTYETQTAQDAEIQIDGITFTSQTNQFTGVITGVDITVKETGETTLTISNDYTDIKNSLTAILDGYNQLKETIRLATSEGQPLQGEATLNTIANSVFNIISTYLGKYGLIDTLGDAETTRGLLTLNEEAFNTFMERPDAKGILQSFGRALEDFVGVYSDTLTLTDLKYQEKADYLQERIETMTESIDREIESMRIRFAQLNTYLSEMQSLQITIQSFVEGLPSISGD
ncbi:MAG: flagellar filament capping protein FliD [Aquificae bacterium]|nr:flagellar filament capping protein FliD [Aquificota bacterium]